MSPRPLKVFLCHAHADSDPVRGLYTHLTNDGVDVWLDKAKLLPGQDWELEIRKAVREADVVVVCLSKQFNQAGFRQKEVRLALDTAMEKPEGEIFIIPARLEECDNLESLRKWHWVDLFEDDGYEMLMRALRARASKIGATLQVKEPLPPISNPIKTGHISITIIKYMGGVFGFIALVLIMIFISSLVKQPQSLPMSQITPSAANPMAMIEEFAKQTAAVQTAFAQTGSTRQIFSSPIPSAINPMAMIEEFAKQTVVAQTQQPLTDLSLPTHARPKTYTTQSGAEFPYCIARRYDVDPDQLLQLSGINSPDVYYAGLTLTIPQSGHFPGTRALGSHPTVYTVISKDENLYSVACKFGDVFPEDIALVNGLSVDSALSAG